VPRGSRGCCVHRLTGGTESYCYLQTNRFVDATARVRSLVFQGRDECWPILCDDPLVSVCPFWQKPDADDRVRGALADCDCCGRRHQEGSTTGELCRSWHEVKTILNQMRRDLPEGQRYYENGTTDLPYAQSTSDLARYLLWPRIKAAVLRRDHCACQDCGVVFDKGRCKIYDRNRGGRRGWSWEYLEVHHIVPRSRGGSDHPGNLKTLCPTCHRRYTSDLITDLVQEARHEREVVKALAAYRPGEDETEYPWDIGGD
jgi:5-methylcytosine-specific restriction endonuclease McrA